MDALYHCSVDIARQHKDIDKKKNGGTMRGATPFLRGYADEKSLSSSLCMQ